VVKLDLIIAQFLFAVLASIIIATHDSHHRREGYLSPTNSARLSCLRESLCCKEYGTNMAEHIASGLGKGGRNRIRKIALVETVHLRFEVRSLWRFESDSVINNSIS
jgi:hypothetical protein